MTDWVKLEDVVAAKKPELLFKYGLSNNPKEANLFDIISESDYRTSWRLKIISYDWCKKIADYCGVVIKETPLFLTQPNSENLQQHIRAGYLWYKWDNNRDNRVFTEWEASKLNTWKFVEKVVDWKKTTVHDERTKIDAQYKSAMAYKRFWCRWVLRLLNITGFYSAVESPTFIRWEKQEIDYNSL